MLVAHIGQVVDAIDIAPVPGCGKGLHVLQWPLNHTYWDDLWLNVAWLIRGHAPHGNCDSKKGSNSEGLHLYEVRWLVKNYYYFTLPNRGHNGQSDSYHPPI